MKKIFYTLLSLSLLHFSANAQWTNLNVPHGNNTFLHDVEVPNENTVWGGITIFFTFLGQPFTTVTKQYVRTTDAGATWEKKSITAPSGYSIANLFAFDADTCYSAMYNGNTSISGGIFKTTNGGTTWTQLAVGKIFDANSFPDFVYFWNPKDGIAFGDGNTDSSFQFPYLEVYKTSDYGDTWQRVPKENFPTTTDVPIGIVNRYSVVGDTIWAEVYDGTPTSTFFPPHYIYRSDDRGLHWQAFPITTPQDALNDFVFTDSRNGVIIGSDADTQTPFLNRSSDGGATWTSINYSGPLTAGNISNVPGTSALVTTNSLSFGPQGSSYSWDLGDTWTLIDTGIDLLHTDVKFFNSTTGWSGQYRQNSTDFGGIFQWTGSIFPVALQNFKGILQNNNALLTWSTATETNNKGFSVERSTDGRNFKAIGFVNGHGTSTQVNNYSYTDADIIKLATSSVYYRLKQVDFDGKEKYSGVVKLDLSKIFSWNILPNPIINESGVQLQLNAQSKVSVQVISVSGKTIQVIDKGSLPEGSYSIPLNLSAAAKGAYYVRLAVNGETFVKTVVK